MTRASECQWEHSTIFVQIVWQSKVAIFARKFGCMHLACLFLTAINKVHAHAYSYSEDASHSYSYHVALIGCMQMSSYWGSGTAVGKRISRPVRGPPRRRSYVRATLTGISPPTRCSPWLSGRRTRARIFSGHRSTYTRLGTANGRRVKTRHGATGYCRCPPPRAMGPMSATMPQPQTPRVLSLTSAAGWHTPPGTREVTGRARDPLVPGQATQSGSQPTGALAAGVSPAGLPLWPQFLDPEAQRR